MQSPAQERTHRVRRARRNRRQFGKRIGTGQAL